jgi:hypothetical protein
MFNISLLHISSSNIVEMRKLELVRVGEELYEVIKKIPIQRFTKEVAGENAEVLKEYYKVEKILRSNQTNEYLFVNLIQEAIIDD